MGGGAAGRDGRDGGECKTRLTQRGVTRKKNVAELMHLEFGWKSARQWRKSSRGCKEQRLLLGLSETGPALNAGDKHHHPPRIGVHAACGQETTPPLSGVCSRSVPGRRFGFAQSPPPPRDPCASVNGKCNAMHNAGITGPPGAPAFILSGLPPIAPRAGRPEGPLLQSQPAAAYAPVKTWQFTIDTDDACTSQSLWRYQNE